MRAGLPYRQQLLTLGRGPVSLWRRQERVHGAASLPRRVL